MIEKFSKEYIEPKAVLFDLDGLMFDSEREVMEAWDITGVKMGYGKLGHNIYNTLGLNKNARVAYFEEHYGGDFPYEEFQTNYRGEVHKLAGANDNQAKPGLFELLDYLKSKAIPMAVASSSSPTHAAEYISRNRVKEYFEVIITGDMVHKAKPDPEIYLMACESLHVKPCEALVLEDSYNGIRSAHSAGIPAIMIPDLLTDITPVKEMLYARADSLLDVMEYLKGINANDN